MSSAGHRRYVAGFLFCNGRVLLVRKTHPAWQAKLMNGVGGGIEKDETAAMAMRREFLEETGIDVESWDYFAIEHGPGYEVLFFRYFLHDREIARSANNVNDTGEELEWCDPVTPKFPVIGNLNWLLPLALDPRPIRVTARTTGDIRKLMTW
jgi:8-oxo-dGTP pyrophosphatase MutT (NUDIX family)